MVENFTGLINKSNYRGSWTTVFMVAAIDLEIAMTKQFMAQQPDLPYQSQACKDE